VVAKSLNSLNRRDDRWCHQEHAGAAAKRAIVDLLVFALSPGTNIVPVDLDETPIDCLAQDRLSQETREEFRKEGQNIEAQGRIHDDQDPIR
jgi:hypothetical protein